MITKRIRTIDIVRAVLIVLTVLMLFFVLRNGLVAGEASAEESYGATQTLQKAVGLIDPDSPIATATGAEFDLLHACVRDFAHFFEYFLLALFAFGAYLSFARKGKWRFAPITPCFLVATIALDEAFQSLTLGRAAQLMDVLVDSVGALFGMVVSFLIFCAIQWICINIKKEDEAYVE